jgi:nucleoside-diphosphate-sugar epimerase
MKILITGGAGYVGGWLTDRLNDTHEITVLDSLLYETRFLKNVDFINGDVRDTELLSKILPDYDCVIWLAAIVGDGACEVNVPQSKQVNEDSVKWLVDNYKGKIIFTSTCSVYGLNNDLISEDASPNPLSVYAETKLAAEQYIINNHNDYLIFRLGTLHGIGDLFSRVRLDLVVNVLTCKAAKGDKLTVFGGGQWRPLLHVRDVAEAIDYGLKNEVSGLYNLSENNYKIHEIARRIQVALPGTKVEETALKFEDLRNYRVKNNKILATGWRPSYTLDMGIDQIRRLIKNDRITDIKDPTYSNEAYLKKDEK